MPNCLLFSEMSQEWIVHAYILLAVMKNMGKLLPVGVEYTDGSDCLSVCL